MPLHTNGMEATPPGRPPVASGTGVASPPLTKSSVTISHCLHPPEKICLYVTDDLLQLRPGAN